MGNIRRQSSYHSQNTSHPYQQPSPAHAPAVSNTVDPAGPDCYHSDSYETENGTPIIPVPQNVHTKFGFLCFLGAGKD